MQSDDRSAFDSICNALEHLDNETQSRIIKSVVAFFDIDFQIGSESASNVIERNATGGTDTDSGLSYLSFAEIYADAGPSNNLDKALVAGFWLQVCQQNSKGFKSQDANKELENIGYKVKNITNAFTRSINRSPQLVLQIKKGGKSQQARKMYKLTEEGINRVREMIDG